MTRRPSRTPIRSPAAALSAALGAPHSRGLARFCGPFLGLVGALGSLGACGTGDDNASSVPPPPDGGTPDATAKSNASPEGGEGGALQAEAQAPTAQATAGLRIGNLSAALPMAMDVCLGRPTAADGGDTFSGLLLGGAFSADDAGNIPGVSFPQLSSYVNVPAGTLYDVSFVSAGASDCSQPLFPPVTGQTFKPGTLTTLAVVGDPMGIADAGTALTVLSLKDDLTTPVASDCGNTGLGCAAIRFINAAPNVGAADLALDGTKTTFFKKVAFEAAGKSTGTADRNGYGAFDAPEGVTFGAVNELPDGGKCTLTTLMGTLGPGSVSTVVLVPGPQSGNGPGYNDAGDPFCLGDGQLVIFVDNAGVASTDPSPWLGSCLGCDAGVVGGM